MKILLTVDPEIPVPPTNYGGIERIVSSLSKAYTQKGHEVILLANPNSTEVSAQKIIGWKGLTSRGKKDMLSNTMQIFSVVRKYKPDIIHSFSRLFYLFPVFLLTKSKVVQTYQRRISKRTTNQANLLAQNKIKFTSCASYMHEGFANNHKWHGIYNFTDTNFFTFNENSIGEYLFFLGRIEDIKGTKEAIEVALATNIKLIIAGNIQEGHDDYFEKYIQPNLDNPLIEYVGPVNDEQKRDLLQKAKAFLFPIKWEEPFGIVMAEAMACGVPVIGFRRGSVAEVVKEGETGFIVDDVEGMIDAVKQIDSINRENVRKECVQRFSLEVISQQYIDLFNRILNNES